MSNELDDLFRQQLDGHASEPAANLWARLQAQTAANEPAAEADPLDGQFRAGLAGHATPLRRELWERLEDEHLRPRQRRRPVVAWGRLAIAASLLLLVLAGGAGLWLARPGQVAGLWATNTPATTPAPTGPVSPSASAEALAAAKLAQATAATRQQLGLAAPAGREKMAEIFASRATSPGTSPSSSPVARTARPPRSTTRPRLVPGLPHPSSPDAVGTLAHDGGRNTPSGQPNPAPALAVATPPAAEPEVILVEIRRGPAPAQPAAPTVVATADHRPAHRPRVRLGGLLRQAGHLVQGEPVSLADAGLPDSLTFQTRLGSRLVSRTIRL